MRCKRDTQGRLDFQPSTLAITNEYRQRYARVSEVLDANPKIVDAVHRDLATELARVNKARNGGRRCRYTTENALRAIVCQVIEGESLRVTCIRIDESNFLRRFVRVYDGPMMDFTTLDRFKNAVRPETWKNVNDLLAKHAVGTGQITGDCLRLDTTAFESNVHYPADSNLMWDAYRVLSRIIKRIRELDSSLVGSKRLQIRRVRRLNTWLARKAWRKGANNPGVQERYAAMIGLVEAVLAWSDEIEERLRRRSGKGVSQSPVASLVAELRHYRMLGERVVDQTRRRVLEQERVPADEKLYSIFEPHTELIKRGKTGKPIEFGHMVHIQQTEEKFITDYEAFAKRPLDKALVDGALESHKRLFGDDPSVLAADKGYYESMDKIEELEERIEVVSICKKGSRTAEEYERERSFAFRFAQVFRAGIEGTISFLKRALRMHRCFNKGWDHYCATFGSIVFAHNLLILARGG